jgi:ATP-dependent DNA helicase RecG
MTIAELLELIESLRAVETDTLHVEAKRAERELPKRLWETLSAFSNVPGGGVVILGLDEMSAFDLVGVKNARKMQQDLASLCDQMEPSIRPAIGLHRVEGKTLVVAEVPELGIDQKPCYYRGAGLTNGAFIRVADGDRKLSTYEVQVMLASRGQPREDEEPVAEASVGDLDPDLVSGLLGRLRQPEGSVFRRLPDEEALRTLKVLVPLQDHWVPSLGGLLALGTYPQQFFPALRVTFVVYPTTRLGEPGPRGERFLDNRYFDGPVPRMVRPVLDALQRNMKRRAIVRGAYREDLWEYPEESIREALVNALAHRDLSGFARGSPVQVQMFPDRLLILNPGGLYGAVTLEHLGEEGVSSARNQVLMKLLEDVPAPGEARVVCENRGSGIGAMLAALRRAGMSLPRFEDRISTFQVTFPNHSLLDEETLRWLERVRGGELTDSQRMALAVMRRGETLTNRLYRQLTGLDSYVVTREFNELVSRALVDRVGTGRWTSYRLSPRQRDEPNREAGVSQRRDRRLEILDLLRQRGTVSRAEIMGELGLGIGAVRKWLARLRSEGMVEITTPNANSPQARYRLSTPERPTRTT